MNLINEKLLNDYPKPVFIEETEKILRQMKKSVCKIFKKDGQKGTGFFCKIPLNSKIYLPTFITNNHIIDEQYLNKENDILIKWNDGKNTTSLNFKNKFRYTNKTYDITIIVINEKIDVEFLTLDENIKDSLY